MVRIGVLSYGVGNLFSVVTALSKLGAEVVLLKGSGWDSIDGLVIPGVGNFEEGSRNIASHRERIHLSALIRPRRLPVDISRFARGCGKTRYTLGGGCDA